MKKSIQVTNLVSGIVRKFPSISAAARGLRGSKSGLSNSLKNSSLYKKKYKLELIEKI